MRRAIILSLIILLSQPLVSATDVSTNTEEDSSGTLSGDYTVKNGATWTISGDYEIADDTSIVVEEGATMIVSGSMNSTQPPQLDLAVNSSVIVPVNNIAASGTMRIHFATPVIFGIGIEINDVDAFSSSEQTSENWTAIDEFDWTGNMDVENITVNISNNLFNQAVISHITLSPSGSTPVILSADQLSGEGTSVVVPDKQGSWNIDVQGELIVTGTIFGAAISCYSTCSLNGANMRSSGPIEVFGTITVENSNFDNGVIDEDIIVWDQADVTWTNSNGTGGETDNWVRILSTRTIGVENGNVWFMGYGIGYDGTNTSQLRDNSTFDPTKRGDNTIEFATDKRSRIIEWRDGNGVEHEENASGLVVLSTQWGDYEQQINDLPRENHFDVSLELPKLTFDSLVAESNDGITDERLGVTATISNSGNSPAEIYISCTANGEDADVGLTVTRNIPAKETKEIPMGWYSANEGDLVLECSIFVPDEFDGYEVVTVGGATSATEEVTWITQEDEDAGILMALVIGLLVAAALYGLIWWSMKRNKTEKEHLTDIGEDDETLDEDEGVIE